MRRKLNIGSLTGNTNYIGKIQKVIIIGFLVSRKNQAAPLGCRPARFGDIFVKIFMRVMECVRECMKNQALMIVAAASPICRPLSVFGKSSVAATAASSTMIAAIAASADRVVETRMKDFPSSVVLARRRIDCGDARAIMTPVAMK